MWRVACLLLVLSGLGGLCGCRKVEGTGRSQLILTSESSETAMGLQAFQDVLKKERRCTDPQINALIERVGRRIAAAAPQKGFQYEFVALESKEANAFCLPGGKVCFYTGILAYCQNEAGIATVMGHEVAHAIARHGGERMTQGLIVQGALTGLDAALKAKGVEPTKNNLLLAACGAGAQFGLLLPYSRTHEFEADYLGLTYMSKAGYDPRQAEAFWTRFGTEGSRVQSWFSTHPYGKDRAQKMHENLPKMLALYQTTPQYGVGEPVPARFVQKPPL